MIKELWGIPDRCILIIVDGKAAWVGYSLNPVSSIVRISSELKGRATNPELRVVSAGADIETLRLHVEYYRNYYHGELNYGRLLPYGRKAIGYRIRVIPVEDNTRIDVELVTARGDSSKVVGRFKTAREAEDFIETYYRTGNPLLLPVLALNSDTKEFMLEKHTKLLELK